jgi:hypothetical protein
MSSKGLIKTISKSYKLMKGKVPRQLYIRYYNIAGEGKSKNERNLQKVMDFEYIKMIIRCSSLNEFETLTFVGDEMMFDIEEFLELVEFADINGIKNIKTGFNEKIFSEYEEDYYERKIGDIAKKISLSPLKTLYINIDSINSKIHEERKGMLGIINGIVKAIPIFHEFGIYPCATMNITQYLGGEDTIGLNIYKVGEKEYYNIYKNVFRQYLNYIIDLGFTMVNLGYEISEDKSIFSKSEKLAILKALYDILPEYRHRIRIHLPRCAIYSVIKAMENNSKFHMCRAGCDFFYINTENEIVSPCIYKKKEDLGEFYDIEFENVERINCSYNNWGCLSTEAEFFGAMTETSKNISSCMMDILEPGKYMKLCKEDANYYKKCDFFDGRKPLNYKKLLKS